MTARRADDPVWQEKNHARAENWRDGEAVCPNEGDDFLCAWHEDIGAFVPEASCPKHDPDPQPKSWKQALAAVPEPDFGTPIKPASRFNENGACTYCGHTRDQHGERKCGLLLAPRTAIFCGCPYNKETP